MTGTCAAMVFVLPTLLSMTFESGVAVYVGLVVYALFGRVKSETGPREHGGSGSRLAVPRPELINPGSRRYLREIGLLKP